MRKKLLMISRAVEPPWDEASKNLVRDISNMLDDYQFHILTTGNTRKDKENIVNKEIYSKWKLTLFQKLRLVLFLIRKRTDYDLYHFCFTPELLTSFLSNVLIDKRKKIWSLPYISLRLSKKNIKKLAENTSIMTVTSEFSKEIFKDGGACNVEVVYPGVDLEIFKPINKSKTHKEGGGFTVFFPGDISKDAIIMAVESIIKETVLRTTSVNFIVASRIKKMGDARRKNGLKDRLDKAGLQDRIRFIEGVKDMPALLADCDLVLYPHFEDFGKKIDIPYIVVEAMACGKPVLISDRRPLNEVMKNGAGMAVSTDNPYEFAKAIIKLNEDQRFANNLGMRNRQVTEMYFDINKNMKRFASIYKKVLCV